MYELPKALEYRLINLGYTKEQLTEHIQKYKEQAISYIKARLGNKLSLVLDENQLELLTEQYIQYQLFSMAELDSYVEDKKRFIDDLIKDIKEDYLKMGANDLEGNKHKRRIYVF